MRSIDLATVDLPTVDGVEAAPGEISYRRRTKVAPSWRETIGPRLLAGCGLFAIPLFVYFLMSLPNPLQPAFTTTEALLALVLLGLVVSRT
jgi:hypothetical protein